MFLANYLQLFFKVTYGKSNNTAKVKIFVLPKHLGEDKTTTVYSAFREILSSQLNMTGALNQEMLYRHRNETVFAKGLRITRHQETMGQTSVANTEAT